MEEETCEQTSTDDCQYPYIHLPLLLNKSQTCEVGQSIHTIGMIKIVTGDDGYKVYQLHILPSFHYHVEGFPNLKFNMPFTKIPTRNVYAKIYGYVGLNSTSERMEVCVNVWTDLGDLRDAEKLDMLLHEINYKLISDT